MKVKNQAHVAGERVEVRNIQKQIKCQVKTAKELYREKIERSFHENNPKTAWKTLQNVTGYKRKSSVPESIVCQTFVDNLNKFYCRFDKTDFLRENTEVNRNLKENSFDGFSYVLIFLSMMSEGC